MTLRLAHINFPSRDPERLARWYEKELGLQRRDCFLYGADDSLIVFEEGDPIGARGNTHFGFVVESEMEVERWAAHFGAQVEAGPGFASTKIRDPDQNCIEIFWEEPPS
jgi:catechol 2,3-dioxygenase-like lactoylglutathione lyase family enzyme